MNFELSTFHDAQFLGVSVSSSGDELVLSVLDQGLHTSLFFGGVKAFRLVDMQIQNIIYRLHVHSGPGVDGDKLIGLIKWVSSSVDAKPYMADQVISRYVSEIERGELALVVIEPSAGAELSLLCEVVEHRKE